MKKNDTHAFVNHLIVYALVMICCSGSVGMGAVWMRHQISVAANNTKRLEVELADTERRLAEVNTFIASELTVDSLDRRNSDMRLGLVRPKESQVVRVGLSVEDRLLARRNAEILEGETFSPMTVKFAQGGVQLR